MRNHSAPGAVAQRLLMMRVKVEHTGEDALLVKAGAACQVSRARLPHQRRMRDLAASL